jgi:hypothetical protein
MPSIMFNRFLRLLRHCIAGLEIVAIVVGVTILCGGWESHLFRLFYRSWHNFLGHVGTTGPGFFSPVIVSILCVLGTLLCIRFLQGREAMLKHWSENAAITALVTIVVLLVVYGPQFAWQLVRTIYDDHQSLVAQVKKLQIDIPEKDKEIIGLKDRLTATCFMPDRKLTAQQRDKLYASLRMTAEQFHHPHFKIGYFNNDMESLRYAGMIVPILRDAGFISERDIIRPPRLKADDAPDLGFREGLSIQVEVDTAASTLDPLRQQIIAAILQDFGNAQVEMTSYPVGAHWPLKQMNGIVIWVGYKKVDWLNISK